MTTTPRARQTDGCWSLNKVKFRDEFHGLRQGATIGSMEDEANDHGLTLEDMTKEVQQRLNLLSESLPLQIDPIGLSRTKLPFKVLKLSRGAHLAYG